MFSTDQPDGAKVTSSQVWYKTLVVLSELSPLSYWRLKDGAEFWLTPLASNLLPDRVEFEEDSPPIFYRDIRAITVFNEGRLGQAVAMKCDWAALRVRLSSVTGLGTTELRDVDLPPAAPRNEALELTLFESGG